MGDNSHIEWTDATWNVVTGCSKVSAGCKFCYAERIWKRVYGKYRPFTDVHFHEDRLELPLRWKRPRMIFVNSLSDLFHEKVTDNQIMAIVSVMAEAKQHIFQVLTKRPVRMRAVLGDVKPLPNVWLGVSVENQGTAEQRIPHLLDVPAAVRWVSVEPLLGPVWLTPWLLKNENRPGLDWVVVGGESGPHARPFDAEWAREIRRRCKHIGVPFFMKQLGSRPFDGWRALIVPGKGDRLCDFPPELQVREYPQRRQT